MNKKYWILLIIVLALGLMLILPEGRPSNSFVEETFNWLEEVRNDKRSAIESYFDELLDLANNIVNDEIVVDYFHYSLNESNSPSKEYQLKIDKHFINKYNNFYDILFVKENGFVFNTIKRETDYLSNIFEGELANTTLAKKLKGNSSLQSVSFEYYSPSNEEAAFFTVPVINQNELEGWFILQIPLNQLNTILTDHQELGRTGEVYLVSEEKIMLTESRFVEDASMLRLKVDSKAVKLALEDESGNKIIKDYRGVNVFSSFEKFELFGIQWIIIAEIDEDEVLTNHFKKYESYYIEEICNYLQEKTTQSLEFNKPDNLFRRVDVNEFSKTTGESVLYSVGVSTCTGAVILYKEKFGYLAHISPIDKIYISNSIFNTFSEKILNVIYDKKMTDFLEQIIHRITYYELFPSQLKNLEVILVATHKNSIARAIDIILSEGIEITNIKFMYDPSALNASVFVDLTNDHVLVDWNYRYQNSIESSKNILALGEIIKKIVHSEF